MLQGNLSIQKKIYIVENIFANNLEKNYPFVSFVNDF